MTRLKPDAVFVVNLDDAASVDLAIESVQQSPPKALVVLDGPSKLESNSWTSLLDLTFRNGETIPREQESVDFARLPDPDRIDLMAFTSGTSSGSPKGCPRHEGGNVAAIDSQADLFRFNKDSRYLLASAYFRIIAPVLSVAVWSKGGAIVMPSPNFDPKRVMRAIQDHKITHVLFVPFQLHALTRDDSFAAKKTSAVKYAILGADIITKEHLRKAKRSFPSAKFAAGHGMTEGGAVFYWPYYEAGVDAVPDYSGISALGTAAPGAALRIYDIDNSRVAKRNEPGEFQILSPTTIKNYLGNEDQEAFLEDSIGRWFKTGDVGLMNGDGVIFLLGRLGDRIKRAGIRITPAALETSLSDYIGAQVSPCIEMNRMRIGIGDLLVGICRYQYLVFHIPSLGMSHMSLQKALERRLKTRLDSMWSMSLERPPRQLERALCISWDSHSFQ
jgi:4-coumarate--CoA ligase